MPIPSRPLQRLRRPPTSAHSLSAAPAAQPSIPLAHAQALERWNYTCKNDQFIACRKHFGTVSSLATGSEPGKIWWHVAEISLTDPCLGLRSFVVMSLHLNNKVAKKTVAGPECIARALDAAVHEISTAGRPSIDIICGDINMARTGKANAESGLWHDATLSVFESRRLIPVADWSGDCCFIGVRETLVQQLLVQGKSWGESTAAAPAASASEPAAAPAASASERGFARSAAFLERVGAQSTSKDVHWPYTIHLRLRPGPETRASGLRRRSAAAAAKRNTRKEQRYGENAFGQSSHGRLSGSARGWWDDAQWQGWGAHWHW